jgi:enamine deaminase RidA (YjgF/YER057c/UK114 family)
MDSAIVAGYRARLAELGLELPDPPAPKGLYLPWQRHGGQLWLSGVTGRTATAPALQGVVGEDLTVEDARGSARLAAANLVGAIVAAGAADEVSAVLFLRGYVRSGSTFDAHPAVIDAASEVLAAVLQVGPSARAAIGVASLPGGACVELEAVVAVGGPRSPNHS